MAKPIVNDFGKGMYLDSHPAYQPEGTYREAYNAIHTTDQHIGYGLTNETSSELVRAVNGTIVGLHRIPQEDWTIVFVDNGASEIHYFDHKTNDLVKIVSDSEFGCDWQFSNCKWIGEDQSEYKIMQSGCKELMLYWSSGDIYRKINVTALLDPDRRDQYECDDFLLLNPACGPRMDLDVIRGGGRDLSPGHYFFAAKLEDDDGNDTNWFFIEGPVYLGSEHNDPVRDEFSEDSVRIRLTGLNKNFTSVKIAVIPPVYDASRASGYVITNRSFNTEGVTIDYYSTGQHNEQVNLTDILAKRRMSIRGCNMFQKDGRLFLYKLRPESNLNYQRKALDITSKYVVYAVPSEEAWRFKTFMSDEVYRFGIQWKYDDGTHSPVFHIPGREGGAGESEFCGCAVPDWEHRDTSERTTTYLTYKEAVKKYCVERAVYTTENEGDSATNCGGGTQGFTSNVGSTLPDVEDECVNDTTYRNTVGNDVDGFQTTNDSLDDCLDCAEGTTGSDLDRTDNLITRGLEKITDLFKTDKEVSEDCEIGKHSTIKDAAKALFDEAVTNAEKDEEYSTAQQFVAEGTNENISDGVSQDGQNAPAPPSSSNNAASGSTGGGTFEFIYDEDTCQLVDIKPAKVAEGNMGIWQSCEVYPETKDCDGEYLYGDLAGQPIRDHKMPSRGKERHFFSYGNGVESRFEPNNDPAGDTMLFFLGVKFENIQFPTEEELNGKKLCPQEPYRILMVKRELYNASVQAKGYFTNTFYGQVGGETVAIPRHGVNGKINVDANISNAGGETRDGTDGDDRLVNFHSPDVTLAKRKILTDYAKIDAEIFGSGTVYGHYAEGKEPENDSQQRMDRRGTRAAVNLNKAIFFDDETRCVEGAQFAPANSKVRAGFGIETDLMNKHRESSMYLQLESGLPAFQNSFSSFPGTLKDKSVNGSTLDHTFPIGGTAHYGGLYTKNKCQYGGIEGLKYVDIGMAGRPDQTSIDACTGDAFIGKWSEVRTSYISDKVGNMLNRDYPTPLADETYLGDPDVRERGVCSPPNRRGWRMREFMGFWNGTEFPEPGDRRDPKNASNLFPGQTWEQADGQIVPLSDYYYPQTYSCLNHLWVESNINLHYRKSGDPEVRDVFYEELHGLDVDSSINDVIPEEAFLNDFHAQQKQASKMQNLKKRAIRAFLVFVMPALMLGGLAGIDTALDAASTVLISPAMVTLWAILTYNVFTNKKLNRMLGIPECKTDDEGKRRKNHLRGLKDNYFQYNWGYSAVNDQNNFYGMPRLYNTCICNDETTDEILYSNKQILGSLIDAYENFRANNFAIMRGHTGTLQKLLLRNGQFLAHTTDGLWALQNLQTAIPTSAGEIYLGGGNLLAEPVQVMSGVKTGFAGTEDPNGGINEAMGYFFVDHEGKKLYQFNNGVVELAGEGSGVSKFFNKNLTFKTDDCRDQKKNGGTHYAMGYDHRNNRLFFTKSDGAYSFTASYDPLRKVWVSFHDFIPQAYFWDRDRLYAVDDSGIHLLNASSCSWGSYMGNDGDFVVNVSARIDGSTPFHYDNTVIDTETNVCAGDVEPNLWDRPFTFDEILVTNQFQTTGPMQVKLDADCPPNLRARLDSEPGFVRVKRVDLQWNFNNVKDHSISHDDPLFEQLPTCLDGEPKNYNCDHNWTASHKVFGKFLNYRFTFKRKDAEIAFKKVFTYVKVAQEKM